MANSVNPVNVGSLGEANIINKTYNFGNIRVQNNSSGKGTTTVVKKAAEVTVTTIDFNKFFKSESIEARVLQGEGKTVYVIDGACNQHRGIKFNGEDFTVAATPANIFDYVDYLQKKKFYQAADKKKRNSWCQNIAYVHAYGYYSNNQSYKTKNLEHGNCGGSFSSYIDDDLDNIMAVVYNEIMNGRPVIIQVNGNKEGTSRHFVTVVGFSSKVKSSSELKATDFLIIDPWDGSLSKMSGPDARFLTTGADCQKDYNGYYIRYIKHESQYKNKNMASGDSIFSTKAKAEDGF